MGISLWIKRWKGFHIHRTGVPVDGSGGHGREIIFKERKTKMFPELGKDMSFEVYPLIQNKDNFTLTFRVSRTERKINTKKGQTIQQKKGKKIRTHMLRKKVCNGHLKRRSISLIT